MSTAAPTSTSLAEPRPLQTFMAPTKYYPIAMSVLWMSIPELSDASTEELETTISMTLTEPRFADNPHHAVSYFLSETLSHELKITLFLLKLADEPSLTLMRYAVSLEDSRFMGDGRTDLLNTRVVINRSPPSEEILGKLLSTGVIGIGTYTGMWIVPVEASPFLLLACVSGGIICISTAVGMGAAVAGVARCLVGMKDKPRTRLWAGVAGHAPGVERPERDVTITIPVQDPANGQRDAA